MTKMKFRILFVVSCVLLFEFAIYPLVTRIFFGEARFFLLSDLQEKMEYDSLPEWSCEPGSSTSVTAVESSKLNEICSYYPQSINCMRWKHDQTCKPEFCRCVQKNCEFKRKTPDYICKNDCEKIFKQCKEGGIPDSAYDDIIKCYIPKTGNDVDMSDIVSQMVYSPHCNVPDKISPELKSQCDQWKTNSYSLIPVECKLLPKKPPVKPIQLLSLSGDVQQVSVKVGEKWCLPKDAIRLRANNVVTQELEVMIRNESLSVVNMQHDGSEHLCLIGQKEGSATIRFTKKGVKGLAVLTVNVTN